MYQVIARKYRPRTFSDLVNQEHVKTTLANAIAQGRIAHGYIFSGQRGTGKTTVARILARCLNCVEGPTATPCGACASCRETGEGAAVDVIEIDAASNRGINEMRELRENVRYRPARDRFKVFIIDEAHQITNEAFNALLKTIEEPPSWVVFVLCTTETHKIPATIASRCQQFSFRSVEFESLVERLAWICGQEGVEADPATLAELARAGEGSVRDSLSALDQAIACCGTTLRAEDVRSLLGGFSLETLHQVTAALSSASTSRMLDIVDELERNGQNLQHFSRELARHFRNLLVARAGDPRLIPGSADERARLAEIAAGFSEEDLTRYLQLSLDLFRDLQYSLQPRFHLELGLVRMVHAGRLQTIEEALASLGPAPAEAPRPAVAPRPRTVEAAAPKPPAPRMSDGANALAPKPAPEIKAAAPDSAEGWKQRLHATLLDMGMAFTADGVERSKIAVNGGEIHFETPKECVLGMRPDDLAKAVQSVAGRPMRVKVTVGAGVSAAPAAKPQPDDDEVTRRALDNKEVQRFQEIFGGQVRTVRNLKE